MRMVGVPLEREFPSVKAESVGQADAIVLLGGGMNVKSEDSFYPDMNSAADRVWHAVRLYKCGTAPIIICTGGGTPLTTVTLLADLGVPEKAIATIQSPRNTEEEAFAIARRLAGEGDGSPKRILLVTSVWHMRRAMQMFRKALNGSVEIVSGPADYEGMAKIGGIRSWMKNLCPTADCLMCNSVAFNEFYAY